MRIYWLQHVPFEGLGCIGAHLAELGHTVIGVRLWAGDPLPQAEEVDGLIVMGGPMCICDYDLFPWMVAEKALIRRMLDLQKPLLGICLGAQLIAEQLGAVVRRNRQREIGFFPVAGDGELLPERFTAFHWHGDTFDIPDGARRLASSAACENQAFLSGNNVLGLQFHLEMTDAGLRELYQHGSREVTAGPFIRTLNESLAELAALPAAHRLMLGLLKRLF